MPVSDEYASYMLRLWRTNSLGSAAASWQSEIQHIQSGQRWTFASMEALLDFLREQNEFNFEQQQRPSAGAVAAVGGRSGSAG